MSRTELITDPQIGIRQIAVHNSQKLASSMPSNLASSLAWAVLSAVANGSFGVFAKIKPVADAQVSSANAACGVERRYRP